MATHLEPFEWGTVLTNSRFPLSYDVNFLRIERPDDRLTAGRLIETSDRLLGNLGMGHRFVRFDDAAAAQALAGRLTDRGWSVYPVVVMALRRGADRPAEQGLARRATWPEVETAKERWVRDDRLDTSEDRVQQILGRVRSLADATHLRHFAAFDGDEAVAFCDLYSDGRTAQIEDVWTREDHRGRGMARAVVLAAADTALVEAHDLIFLIADDEDWPKELYGRLGFDRIGRVYELEHKPAQT
jgi:predicted GNAT family acetyltransferase